MPGRALVAATILLILPCPGCVDSGKLREAFDPCARDACKPPPPQDCSALPLADWAVDGLLVAQELQLEVDSSRRASLDPHIEDHCRASIAAITWSTDDGAIADVTAQGTSGWVTGRSAGVTFLNARIRFGTGEERAARPKAYRVVPRREPAPGSVVVMTGEVVIPPYVPPGSGGAFRSWLSFTTTAPGRIDVVVDWVSPLNWVDVAGFEGKCSATVACGPIVMTTGSQDRKPQVGTFNSPRTPAGDYTLRIDNLGSGEETVRYEVRLTPS